VLLWRRSERAASPSGTAVAAYAPSGRAASWLRSRTACATLPSLANAAAAAGKTAAVAPGARMGMQPGRAASVSNTDMGSATVVITIPGRRKLPARTGASVVVVMLKMCEYCDRLSCRNATAARTAAVAPAAPAVLVGGAAAAAAAAASAARRRPVPRVTPRVQNPSLSLHTATARS